MNRDAPALLVNYLTLPQNGNPTSISFFFIWVSWPFEIIYLILSQFSCKVGRQHNLSDLPGQCLFACSRYCVGLCNVYFKKILSDMHVSLKSVLDKYLTEKKCLDRSNNISTYRSCCSTFHFNVVCAYFMSVVTCGPCMVYGLSFEVGLLFYVASLTWF